MLDRKACKKMWVWDGDGVNPKDTQLIVFEILPNGSCWCVVFGYEKRFVNYESYANIRFGHCEEITEPKYRAFKDGEMPEEWRDYWYRGKCCNIQLRPRAVDLRSKHPLMFGDGWESNASLFSDYEVQKEPNGPWGIVGVEE